MTQKSALVLVDVFNEFDFPGGDVLAKRALPAARALVRLRARMAKAGHPIVFANDNFGRWRSDFPQIHARCSAPHSRGREIATLLKPGDSDHFVLKPRNSAFYQTPLDSLLEYLRVSRLVVCGVAVDNCVLFTANDAHLRGLELIIPGDCVAGLSRKVEARSRDYFHEVLRAKTTVSTRLRF